MAFLYVIPVPGRLPRHESTHHPLPPEGDYWPDSVYTRRRLRDGDIVEGTDPNALPASPPVDSAADDKPDVGTSTRSKRGGKAAGQKE